MEVQECFLPRLHSCYEAFVASHTSSEETIFGKAKIATTFWRLKAVRTL